MAKRRVQYGVVNASDADEHLATELRGIQRKVYESN